MQEDDAKNKEFMRALLGQIPEFRPVYEEHLADNDGEVLTHPLLADFVRFLFAAQQRVRAGGPDAAHWGAVAARGLALMEQAIQDPALTNFIGASFVENLLPDPEDDRTIFLDIREQLGPALRQSLDAFGPR